jgi:hypothetical protein
LAEAFSVQVEGMSHAGWAGRFEFEGKEKAGERDV